MPTDIEAAWDELHDTKPDGWFVGRPSYNERYKEWEQYALDPSKKAKVGVRSREWTAVAASEVEVMRELARCLREVREGRVPPGDASGSPAGPCRPELARCSGKGW